MSARRVVVSFTLKQAEALYRLAACSADTYEDAEAVLVDAGSITAGYNALAALSRVTYGTSSVGIPITCDHAEAQEAQVQA